MFSLSFDVFVFFGLRPGALAILRLQALAPGSEPSLVTFVSVSGQYSSTTKASWKREAFNGDAFLSLPANAAYPYVHRICSHDIYLHVIPINTFRLQVGVFWPQALLGCAFQPQACVFRLQVFRGCACSLSALIRALHVRHANDLVGCSC